MIICRLPSSLLLTASSIFLIVARLRSTSKPDCRMERIGEVNKVVSFFHRDVNVLQRKDFIKKSITDQRLEVLAVNSRFLGLLTPL